MNAIWFPQERGSLIRARYAATRIAIIALILAAGGKTASAQVIVRYYGGTTPYSAAIIAQADYLAAQGSFLVSAGIARKLNADAAEHEMKNSVLWVQTYFERRKLNRQYREAENPSYLQKEGKRQQQRYNVIKYNNHLAVNTDVTDELNWMLHDLLARSSASLFLSGYPQSILSSPNNVELSKEEFHHIRLREGGNTGGKSLEFRADTAELLETRWPTALRAADFDELRQGFDRARDQTIADIKTGKNIERSSGARLMTALDRLSEAFNEAYPRQRRSESSQTYLAYLTSKRYLQSLAVATYRLIETQNQTAFDDSYRFRGSTIGELLQHMLNKGMLFAKAEPGGEGTYQKLYISVRTLYLEALPDAPQGSG